MQKRPKLFGKWLIIPVALGLIAAKRQLYRGSKACNGFIRAMRHLWQPSKEFSSGCLFMATIFAFTSIYKFHVKVDKELSLWMPLHAVAALLSCYHAFRVNRWSRVTAYALMIGSAAVLVKEMSGHVVQGKIDWQACSSLDMQKRDVRETLGSILILLAIGLQLDAFGGLFQTRRCMMTVTGSTALCAAGLIQATSLIGKVEDQKPPPK